MSPGKDNYRPRRSIQRQLIVGISAIHTLLMSIFLWDVLERQRAFLVGEAQTQGLEAARVIAASSVQLLRDADMDTLRTIMDIAGANIGVLDSVVVDKDGTLLAQGAAVRSDALLAELSMRVVNDPATGARLLPVQANLIAAAAPVWEEGTIRAWVIVLKDLRPAAHFLARVQQSGWVYVLLAVLVGTLFAMLLARLITRPLRKLLEGAQQFGAGTLTRPVAVTTSNEIGVVTRAFNEAVHTVQRQRETLREQSEFMQLLTNALPVLIAYVDADARYRFNNRAYWDWFGIEPSELEGQRVIDTIGPEAFKLVEPHIKRALSGEEVRFEAYLPYIHGGFRAVDAIYRPHVDSQGKVAGYFALLVDVTERREAERKLGESEARFRLLADSAPVMIWMSGSDTEPAYFNSTWLEFRGRTLEEEQGDGWQQGIHPDDGPTLDLSMRAQEKRLPFTVQFRMRHASGEFRWLLNTGVPRFDEEQNFLGYIGSAVDITDRMLVEAELREWKNRYEAAVRASEQLLYDWDPQTNEIAWAGEVERILGYQLKDLGRDIVTWMGLIHPEDRDYFESSIERMREEHTAARLQYRVRRLDGRYIYVEDRGDFTQDANGVAQRMIGFVEDISQRKQAELTLQGMTETLEQRVQERTAEANQRATELRLMAMELTQAEQRERRRMAQILHDDLQQLVAVAKLRLGRVKILVEDPEAEEVLQDTDELLTQVIQTARTLSVELSPPVLQDRGLPAALEWVARKFEQEQGLRVLVTAEPGATTNNMDTDLFLLQSVRELLFNIRKHAGVEEAEVCLRLNSPKELVFEVRDAGEGFDLSHLEMRASSEHFGLFSIRQRVAFLGGAFTITSAPGEGTRIQISLPVGASTPVPEPTPPRTATPLLGARTAASRKSLRVMLVDDHQIVRQGLAGLLSGQGDIQIVGEAGDGGSAINLARELHPDVIIMDVSMPGINGIEATRLIHQEMPDIRIVGLSMHEAQDMANAMLDAGAAAYLPKDGPAARLMEAIRGSQN